MLDQEDTYSYRRVGAPSGADRPKILIHIIGALFVLLIIAIGLYCFIDWTEGSGPESTDDPVIRLLLSKTDVDVPIPPEDWLLNLPHFKYLLNSRDACRPGESLYFLALVHSRVHNFRQRQVIRQTWASARSSNTSFDQAEILIRPVFLLGLAQQDAVDSAAKLDVQSLVEAESDKYGDIVQGPFIDHYHNLTLKNLMGLKWAVRHCPNARFILKSDDDAFIDVAQLKNFIQRTFGGGEAHQLDGNTLVCNVQEKGQVQRSGKWAVSVRDYPEHDYPPFCSGLAYVFRPSLARKLLAASRAGLVHPVLWIDDVYVTGLLARAVRAHYFYLNLRYNSNHERRAAAADETANWLTSSSPGTPMPYIVTELDTSQSDWRQLAEKLWNKTLHL